MNPFYVIIRIAKDRTNIDSIAVGLLAFSGHDCYFQVSNKKMKVAKELFPEYADLLDYVHKQLSSKFKSVCEQSINDEIDLFKGGNVLFSSDYYNYLHRYSNNALQFSEPYLLSKEITKSDFQKLFGLLISDDIYYSALVNNLNEEFESRINKGLITRVKDIVHTNTRLSEKVIPSLYFTYEMDCLGMNGVITGAKSIDLNRTDNTVDRNISHYYQIAILLANSFNKDNCDNNFYLIADEPEKSSERNHKIWEKLQLQKQFQVVPSNEVEMIAEKIEETKSRKFLPELVE